MSNHVTRLLAATAILLAATTAGAALPSFQVTRIFSNIDGTQQFIQLEETAGLTGQQHFAGLTLTVTSARGVVKQITFPVDLPSDQTAHAVVLLATEGGLYYYSCVCAAGGEVNVFAPDFVLPVRFVPTEGGTIDFAGADRITYTALPIDGWRGVARDGMPEKAVFSGFHRVPQADPFWTPAAVAQSGGVVIEYYNAALDHYFITASAPDIDAIESGRMAGWTRTGQTFEVAGGPDIYYGPDSRAIDQHPRILDEPVCRFYIPPAEGDSHFYSASTDECAIVKARFPEFMLESSAVFYAVLPDQATGACPNSPAGTVPANVPILVPWRPVFRLWNQRADANHRFTIDPLIREQMIQKGYISEGYGPLGVAFCVGPPVF